MLGSLLQSFSAKAQWAIYTDKPVRNLKYDLMTGFSTNQYRNGYTFFGPTNSLNENVILKGIEFTIQQRDNTSKLLFRVKFRAPVYVSKLKDVFYINCFTSNINSYNICFTDKNGSKLQKEYSVQTGGYQVPDATYLKYFDRNLNNANEQKPSQETDSVFVTEMVITMTKMDNNLPCKFTLGECKLYSVSSEFEPAKGYFFYQLTGNPENQATSYTVDSIGDNYPIMSFTMFRDLNSRSYFFRASQNLDAENLNTQTLTLLKEIIQKYPYYKERRIDQVKINQVLDSINYSSGSFKDKVKKIDSVVNSFSDGHFYIEKKTPNSVPGPVFIKEINGEIQVVGIFQDELKSKVHLGDKVVSVDGVEIDSKINSLMTQHYYGQLSDKRNQILSRLLYKDATDSTSLTLMSEGVKHIVKYYYKNKISIPANFRPSDQDFKKIGNWCYYRLNNWNTGDWINFYNHGDELKNGKGVIFDLRGNSGGSEVEAYKIFSCFIKNLITVTNSEYQFSNESSIRASNIAVPNKFLNLADKPIIILVDNKTACASEIFIDVLKAHSHAMVIGSERTSGSFASGEEFYLPYNIVFKTNILNKFYPPEDKYAIEFQGIEPDIYVPIYNYKDLYPYDDKVLKTAMTLIKAKSSFQE